MKREFSKAVPSSLFFSYNKILTFLKKSPFMGIGSSIRHCNFAG
jgi:hypothetical protein